MKSDRKIPNAVMTLAAKHAARVSVDRPVREDRPEPELRTRRALVREKIVTGLLKLHPMD